MEITGADMGHVQRLDEEAGLVMVAQVGFKPSTKALKPDFKKLNPMSGLKQMFSPNSIVDTDRKGMALCNECQNELARIASLP